jgi:hypothetical protein
MLASAIGFRTQKPSIETSLAPVVRADSELGKDLNKQAPLDKSANAGGCDLRLSP